MANKVALLPSSVRLITRIVAKLLGLVPILPNSPSTPGGEYMTLAPGTVGVTATFGPISSTATVTINNNATNIVISGGDITVTNDDQENSGTLTAATLPSGNTNAITWESSDNNVLTIDANSGSYTTVGGGRATVTARAGRASHSITVTVYQVATNIAIAGDLTIDNGQPGRLTATVLPANHQDSGEVTWASADTSKLTINAQGEYTALAPGTVGVTATFGRISNTATVTINNNATNIVINGGNITVTNDNRENSGTLTATTMPSGNTNAITWESSDNNVLTIDASSGTYTTVGRGRATVTARAGNVSNSITVTVHQAATNISIRGDLTNDNGISGRFTVVVGPTNHQDGSEVTWTSADTSKLTINARGEYLTLAPGTVGVTATLGNVSQTATVTINSNATSIAIDSDDFSISNKATGILTATILPANHTNTNEGTIPNWTAENTNILTIISNTGAYTAVSNGRTTVEVSLGALTDQISITVTKDPVTNVSINGSDFTVTNGTNGVLTAVVLPSDHSEENTNWTSSATNVVSIDSNSGAWRTVAPGQATITAQVGGISDEITITVLEPATNIIINGGNLTVNNKITGRLTATVLPANHTEGDPTWTSADTSKLTINASGDYATLAAGTVAVVAKVGSISNTITVTILNSATNIVIDTNDFTVTNDNQENSGTLTATTLPTGNTSATTWESSDTNVLTIDASSGNYTAVGRGRATITARAGNAANSITVTVHQAATNITIMGDLTNNNGITGRFTATLLPTNHQDNGAVTWTSADTSKLTINSQGEYLTLAPRYGRSNGYFCRCLQHHHHHHFELRYQYRNRYQ